MRHAHEVEVVRAAEAALMAKLPEGTLMQRAAGGLAATAAQLIGRVYGARVGLLVGSGDNGGDALFAGARLAARGARVCAVLLGEHAHEAGLAALRAAGGRVEEPAALGACDLVLDGIVGIGGRGGLRPGAVEALGHVPPTATTVAVDVPSGVDADTGEVAGAAVRADVTVTFGTWKPGLLIDPGARRAGVVECVDIGLRPHLPPAATAALQAPDVAALLPKPTAESDKYRRGVVGVVAGSERYTGAAVLVVGGALRTGVGMVRFVGERRPAELVRARWPEVVVSDRVDPSGAVDVGRVQAWVVGPGMAGDDSECAALARVLSSDLPVIVDAGGLSMLSRDRSPLAGRVAPTVLTPHAGELTRLLGLGDDARADVEARRLHYARAAAVELGATVLLKGSTTVVCAPDGSTRINPTGTAWLATAGSGDVLSGVVGSLLAGGLSALDAASCAAYLHGCAARLAAGGGAPIVAGDVVDALPSAVAALG